jgi:hypothetical protein
MRLAGVAGWGGLWLPIAARNWCAPRSTWPCSIAVRRRAGFTSPTSAVTRPRPSIRNAVARQASAPRWGQLETARTMPWPQASLRRKLLCAASFFAPLECELLSRSSFSTQADARAALFDFIAVFYNRPRRHSALGYLSTACFERRLQETLVVASSFTVHLPGVTSLCPRRRKWPAIGLERGHRHQHDRLPWARLLPDRGSRLATYRRRWRR